MPSSSTAPILQTETVLFHLSIPVDDVLARIEELPTDKRLMFICAQGVRSGLACEMAAAMGMDPEKLFNIEDGTPSWIENGLPTSYGTDE